MRMETTKKVGTLTGFLSGLLIDVPDIVERVAIACIFLVFLDTITGIWYAITVKRVSSNVLRTRFIAKNLQYSILIGIGGAASYVTNHWGWITGLMFAICAIEIFSMTENLVKMEEVGVKLPGFLKKFLRYIGQFFVSSADTMLQVAGNEGGVTNVREPGELVKEPVQQSKEEYREGPTEDSRHLQTGPIKSD